VLDFHPDRVDLVWCQLPFGAGGVQAAFKVIERDLAHDRVNHILDFARQ